MTLLRFLVILYCFLLLLPAASGQDTQTLKGESQLTGEQVIVLDTASVDSVDSSLVIPNVFTPNGDIKSLPKGATAIDFAFAIHTEVGMHCRAAKVNGRLVQLSKELHSGDQVEIITAKNQKPKLAWLDIVKTARAKSKIKSILKEDDKLIANEGRAVLERKLRHLKIPLNEKTTNEMVNFFKLKTSFDLFYQFGNGSIDNTQLKKYANQRSNALMHFFKSKMNRNI